MATYEEVREYARWANQGAEDYSELLTVIDNRV